MSISLNIKILRTAAILLAVCMLQACRSSEPEKAGSTDTIAEEWASIVKDDVGAAVDCRTGNLMYLGRGAAGYNYAGGAGLWRLYYNTKEQKEIEITPLDATPEVSMAGDTIRIDYSTMAGKAFGLHLRIWAADGQLHFGASLENNEPHTIIRELQYPLIGNLQIPADYRLLTTHTGGQIFDNPVW